MAKQGKIYIGTAGWSVPAACRAHFASSGTHLQRYAEVLTAAEINSSFYRPHRPETYAKWADSTPPDFRFSVKVPKTITHGQKLKDSTALLQEFLIQVEGLGPKLGVILVQLPPSLAFDGQVVESFFKELKSFSRVAIACEPRHASWFTPEAGTLLRKLHVAQVAADPAKVPEAAEPGGWTHPMYYRLHGSPRMYYSSYPKGYLGDLALKLDSHASSGGTAWCIFDNTASGAAAENALQLLDILDEAVLISQKHK